MRTTFKRTAVRRWTRRLALASAAVCIAVLPGLPGQAAGAAPSGSAVAAAFTSFRWLSGASFEGANPVTPLGRGSLITVLTDAPIYTGPPQGYNEPWPETGPNGLYVETNACYPGVSKKLRILYVGPSGPGTQINVYYPNMPGYENVYGNCMNWGNDMITVRGANGETITQAHPTVTSRSGIFQNNNGAGPNPEGVFRKTGTNDVVPLGVCDTTPASCPVSTGGVPNEILVLLTGTEVLTCDPYCTDVRRIFFQMTSTAPSSTPRNVQLKSLWQGNVTNYVGHLPGREAATIGLGSLQAGEYLLSTGSDTEPFFSSQKLRVRLGAPN